MRVALLCSRLRVEEKLLRDALQRRGATVEIVDDRELVLDVAQPQRGWDVVLERSLSQTRGLAASRLLASSGIPVINAPDVAAVCADKLATTALLHATGLPVPRTLAAFSPEA